MIRATWRKKIGAMGVKTRATIFLLWFPKKPLFKTNKMELLLLVRTSLMFF